MKPIKFNDNISFTKCRAEGWQVCAYCGKHIGKGKVGLNISKSCATKYNVWIHINCIDKLCKDMIIFKNKHLKEILMESI